MYHNVKLYNKQCDYYAVSIITPKTYYVQLGYSQSCLCYSLYMAA